MASCSTFRKFLIYHQSELIGISLPSDSTAQDLKDEICKRTNIHPSIQSLRALSSDQNVDTEIISETLLDYKRVLYLSTNHNSERDIGLSDYIADMCQRSQEEDAWINFIEKFRTTYKSDHSSFLYCSLNEALSSLNNSPVELRKLIALYFHNENDEFSQMFCPLINGDLRDILARSFHLLGWDLASNVNAALEAAISKWPQLDVTKTLIQEKRAALFILYPTEDNFAIFSMWHGSIVRAVDIYTVLQEIECYMQQDIENVSSNEVQSENEIGVKEFQQLMFDRLGDRDYDSFEFDEHELLKQKIGFAKFGPPQSDNGYDAKQMKEIKNAYECVRKHNNIYAEWQDRIVVSCIYNCLKPRECEKLERSKKYPDYNPYTDMMPIPIFVIQKCLESSNPCRIFIDNNNRIYKSWIDYLNNNKLHKCIMVVPTNGRYFGNENGEVDLKLYKSPACSVGKSIQNGADVVSSVAGITAGGVFLVAAIPAITIAPVALVAAAITGVGVGVYSIVQSSITIADRVAHDETMSFANSEARGAYLNLVAGSLGFIGAGATGAVSKLTANGVKIGQGAQAALNVVNVANVGAGATSVVNSSYEIINNWIDTKTISPLSLLQISSSILFFGHAVYNFRTANTIITETQANTLNSFEQSLKSNRQRKMFDKLLKETVRQHNGNVQSGRAEVISSLVNIPDKADVFAVLARNNKRFNKNNVKFASENGRITLNGVAVDIFQLESMSKTQQFWTDLPSTPQPTSSEFKNNVANTATIFKTVFTIENFLRIVTDCQQLINGEATFMQIATRLLSSFSNVIQEKILRIFAAVVNDCNVFKSIKVWEKDFNDYRSNPYVMLLDLVLKFLKYKMNEYEKEYRQKHGGLEEQTLAFNVSKRGIYFFERVVNMFVKGYCVSEILLEELISYVMSKIGEKMYLVCVEEENLRKRKVAQKTTCTIKCKVCHGYYYSFNQKR